MSIVAMDPVGYFLFILITVINIDFRNYENELYRLTDWMEITIILV